MPLFRQAPWMEYGQWKNTFVTHYDESYECSLIERGKLTVFFLSALLVNKVKAFLNSLFVLQPAYPWI